MLGNMLNDLHALFYLFLSETYYCHFRIEGVTDGTWTRAHVDSVLTVPLHAAWRASDVP